MPVLLPTYAVYLIGFTMLAMFIVIVCLSVALYMALKNKPIFGFITTQKEYIRQDSSNVPTLRTQYFDEQNLNDGSTYTVNSGIIEVTRESEPPTPVPEKTKIIFAKKPPVKAMVPIDRGQMEEICKAVLQKREQRTDSASYRDLNALLNDSKYGKKSELDEESEIMKKIREIRAADSKAGKKENKEIQMEEKIEIKIEKEKTEEYKENTGDIDEKLTHTKLGIQNGALASLTTQLIKELKVSPKLEKKSEVKVEIQPEIKSDVEVKKPCNDEAVTGIKTTTEDAVDSGEVPGLYDTLPTPVRCENNDDDFDVNDIPVYDFPPRSHNRNSGTEDNDNVEDIPVYDLPPRNQDKKSVGDEDDAGNVLVYDLPPRNDGRCIQIVDQEGDYLFPLSNFKTDSCYVNAKTSH